MAFLDVSFGIFAFLPQGWVFMGFVIIIECLILSKFLASKWYNQKIYIVAIISNIISGLFGIITTLKMNGGWLLVVWFPWVSSHEIDIHKYHNLRFLIIFYAIAFFVTLILESIVNILMLRKSYSVNKIIRATILANIISYTVGTVVLYTYSFH